MLITYLQKQRPQVQLYSILLFNLLLRIGLAAFLPISYKEAYFWEWSQYFQWGYLEHPPMVAWLIRASQFIAPVDAGITIRLGALFLGTLSLILVYSLARRLFQDIQLALRAVWIASSIPVLNAVGVLTLPDTPLVFFQLISLHAVASILNDEKAGWGWIVLGISLGLAFMSKLVMGLSVIGLMIAMRGLRLKLLGAVLLAFVVLSPHLLWNAENHWDSLRLQLWERHFWSFGFEFGKLAEYIFEQCVAGTPVLLPLMFLACFLNVQNLPKKWIQPYYILRWQVATVLVICLLATSVITQAHPHWTVLAYAPASILLAMVWSCENARPWVQVLPGSIKVIQSVFIVLTVIVMVLPGVVMSVKPEWLSGSLGRGLVKGRQRLLGYEALCYELEACIEQESLGADARIFTDGYQLSAPLSFAWKKAPVICLPAYTQRTKALGHAQYYYIPLDTLRGSSGLYISRSEGKHVQKDLEKLFEFVKPLAPLEQSYQGKLLAQYPVFRVEGLR